jgi:transcriptional regulator with XRE-family HTH domain
VALGLSQPKLAERCRAAGARVSHAHLSKIERGVHVPRPALRRVLCELLGMDSAEFDQPAETPDTPEEVRP